MVIVISKDDEKDLVKLKAKVKIPVGPRGGNIHENYTITRSTEAVDLTEFKLTFFV